jgi:nucleoside-diphosphate-sugar epimerase
VRRVLATGASGFIGTPCVRELANAGYEVHGAALGAPSETVDGVTYHDVDLLDPIQLHELMSAVQPSHLLHLAWFVAPGDYWTSLENVRWVKAGLDLAREFADAGGTRAVMVGTCAEYQWSDQPLVEEATPLRPTTLYAAAKAGLHLTAKAYFAQRAVSFAWAHLFYLYGPREYPSRLVPAAIRALSQGEPFEVAHPDDVRDFLYVDDVASALAQLLGAQVEGDVNIASGEPTRIGDLVAEIARELDRTDLVRLRSIGSSPSVAVGDTARLADEVLWVPRWTMAEAIAATLEWWESHGAS